MHRIRGSTDASYLCLAPANAPRGTVLSRFRPRAFPGLFCKTSLAASMPQAGFRSRGGSLCAVNVKFTMWLGIGAGLLGCACFRRSAPRGRRGCYTGGVKQVWSLRGEGWGCEPRALRSRPAQTRAGFLRARPFSFCRQIMIEGPAAAPVAPRAAAWPAVALHRAAAKRCRRRW
jgi:hypothetical protein